MKIQTKGKPLAVMQRQCYHVLMKAIAFFVLLSAVFTGCASFGSARAGKTGAYTEPPISGQLTIIDIPQNYSGGIILVSGTNNKGDAFTYSSKVLQKIPGAIAHVKLYSAVSMVQTPFKASGKFTITVILHAENDSTKKESRVFIRNFKNGGAIIRWSDGAVI
jgi:hypothetical protein